MSREEEYEFEPLRLGSSGAIVLMIQKTLNSIGYEVESNGIFDKKMDNVVRSFQKDSKKLPLDGVIGVDTMEEIDRIFSITNH